MERLFERYVAVCLRRSLAEGADLRIHPSTHHLCEHKGEPMFGLEPDLLIDRGADRWILDTKWKLIDSDDRKNNYGLKQSDFYQLFAYGHTYLRGRDNGKLVLIYPKRGAFEKPLPVFKFSEELTLWVLPFDLEQGLLEHSAIVGLPMRSALADADPHLARLSR